MRVTSSTPDPLAGWTETRLLGLLLLAAWLPYANTLLHAFVYDDLQQVLANPYVQGWRHLPAIFGSNVWSFLGAAGVTNHYRPLMTLSYLVCYQVFGPLPFGFHLVNLVIHGAAVWMAFRLAEAVFANRTLAFVAAALFALHPIHTESVAWVAGVTDLQLAFFYLLTFRLFVRLGEPTAGAAWRRYVPLGASFVATLLAKEQGVTLPVLATLYEHAFRPGRATTPVSEKIRRYAPLWLLAAAYLVFRVWLLGAIAPVARRVPVSWPEALLSALALSGQYLGKLLWPVELCAFYVFRKSESLGEPGVLVGAAALAALGGLAIWLHRRAPAAAFSLFWVALTLAPVLNARWMSANVFAERYLYLPSAGFCWLAAWGAWEAWRRAEARWARGAVALALGVVGALYAARTVTRNRDWRDDQTLYTRTLAVSPDAFLIRNNLAALYWNRGEEAAALREWQRAHALAPDHAILLDNLGLAFTKRGETEKAEHYLRQAIERQPNFAEPHFHLGDLYRQMGREAEAERHYRRAAELAPLRAAVRNRLAQLYVRAGRLEEAEAEFRASLAGQPTAEACLGLGRIRMARGDAGEAEQAFRNAAALDPYHPAPHHGLAMLYRKTGRLEEARRALREVLRLDPGNAEAQAELDALRPSPSGQAPPRSP